MSSFSRKFARREARAARRKAAQNQPQHFVISMPLAGGEPIIRPVPAPAVDQVARDLHALKPGETVDALTIPSAPVSVLGDCGCPADYGFPADYDFHRPFIDMALTGDLLLITTFDGKRTWTLRAVPTAVHERLGDALYRHNDDGYTDAEFARRQSEIAAALPDCAAVTFTAEDIEDPARFDALYDRALRRAPAPSAA